MNLGEAIKRRREELDISVEQLAEWSGLTTDKLIRVEGGDPHITTMQAILICEALGCHLHELIEEGRTYAAVCS